MISSFIYLVFFFIHSIVLSHFFTYITPSLFYFYFSDTLLICKGLVGVGRKSFCLVLLYFST